METKVLEVRDSMTCIPVLAIRMRAQSRVQAYYIHERGGYPRDGSAIVVMMLSDQRATVDPYEWPSLRLGNRTMPNAHDYIYNNFDKLQDGDVVDVRVILGEATEPAISERIEHADLSPEEQRG